MAGYRIELTEDDNGTWLVTCPALPEVTTFAETPAEAPAIAARAIQEALAARIDDGAPLPEADDAAGAGAAFVALPALISLKGALYNELRSQGVTRAELARRLEWNRNSVDRLFILDHASRLEQIEAAFAALGRRVDVAIKAASEAA